MKHKKVLIVDDESQIRNMFAEFLFSHEYREADSAEHALRILQSGFEPDYVITDCNMGVMSGIDLAREIRKTLLSRIFVYSGDDRGREAVATIPNALFVKKSLEGFNLIVAAISNNTH